MNTQTFAPPVTAQEPAQSAIVLDFIEGQEVTLLAGAQVGGLTTRCNQPGKVIHIQYNAEFGVTYVVAFSKLRKYAYVSADGLEAVADEAETATPLLDLYPEVDLGSFLPAQLEDAIEYIEQGDLIAWDFANSCEPREGVIVKTRPEIEYALVEFDFGTRRWIHISEMNMILKAAALDIQTKTPTSELISVS